MSPIQNQYSTEFNSGVKLPKNPKQSFHGMLLFGLVSAFFGETLLCNPQCRVYWYTFISKDIRSFLDVHSREAPPTFGPKNDNNAEEMPVGTQTFHKIYRLAHCLSG